ncbi:MAG: MMPL family transporter [Deltaproteobacteria bacterium]|nr:MMPL family transporter [Deltaproteobacteria bacterium]MCB9785664.1 MMPL family transporter [Deltaproteobacteria bacterium]
MTDAHPPASGIKGRVVGFIIGHPWVSLLLGLACFGALIPGAARLAPDFTYRVWFNDDDPLIVEFDAFERRFGNDEAAIVAVHSPSGIFDADSAALLFKLTERLWRVPEVIRVDSLANYNWVHAEGDDMLVEPILPEDALLDLADASAAKEGTAPAAALTQALAELDPADREELDTALAERKTVALNHETLPRYLISPDGNTAILLASLKPAIEGGSDYEDVVLGIREIFKDYEGFSDHSFYQIGAPAISFEFKDASERDLSTLLPLVFGFAILCLLVAFRRVSGIVLPLVVTFLSVGAAMAIGGWLGYSINNLTSIVPQILLAIALADSIHILSNFFRALQKGADRKTAARHTLEKNFLPTILTSVSTAIGFFSFSTAAVVPISMLGTMTGLGTLFAWFFTYTVLGSLIVILPIEARGAVTGEHLGGVTPRGIAWADRLDRLHRPILVGAGLVAILTAVLAARTTVNSDPFEYFPEESDLNVAADFLEANVGGAIPVEMAIESGADEGIKDPDFMRRVEAFQTWVEHKPYVTNAVSLVDILKATNRSLHAEAADQYRLPDSRSAIAEQYLLYTMSLPQGMDLNDRVTIANDALRVTTNWDIHDSNRMISEVEQLKRDAKERFGLDVVITGKSQLWQRMNPAVVRSFVVSISVALVLMTLLMILVFGSVGLGLLAMVPNGLPLIIGGAFLAAVGKPLDVGTVIVFSVCLGIAVDDTIHFLANFNALTKQGCSAHDAIARIYSNTMPALVTTTVVLVAAFGIFAFASFVPNIYFGVMVAFILSVALVADAFLLPALLIWRARRQQPEAPAMASPAPAA